MGVADIEFDSPASSGSKRRGSFLWRFAGRSVGDSVKVASSNGAGVNGAVENDADVISGIVCPAGMEGCDT